MLFCAEQELLPLEQMEFIQKTADPVGCDRGHEPVVAAAVTVSRQSAHYNYTFRIPLYTVKLMCKKRCILSELECSIKAY